MYFRQIHNIHVCSAPPPPVFVLIWVNDRALASLRYMLRYVVTCEIRYIVRRYATLALRTYT